MEDGGRRKEERLPPAHAREGDALPPSREEDSFLEPFAEQGALHVAGADTSSTRRVPRSRRFCNFGPFLNLRLTDASDAFIPNFL